MAILVQLKQWPTREEFSCLKELIDGAESETGQEVYLELPGRDPIVLPRPCLPELLESDLVLIFPKD